MDFLLIFGIGCIALTFGVLCVYVVWLTVSFNNRVLTSVEKTQDSLKKSIRESVLEELTTKFDLEYQKKSLELEKEFKVKEGELQNQIETEKEKLSIRANMLTSQQNKLVAEQNELKVLQQNITDTEKKLAEDTNSLIQERNGILASIAHTTPEQAKKELQNYVINQSSDAFLQWQHKYLETIEEEAVAKAREIVAMAIQRCSSDVANELTVVTVKLDSDEDKGKLIGKAGRNIQWFEKTLGVELIIDETPNVITISGFNSIRRHTAKRTIEKLLEDGRIHPSSIEKMHREARIEIAQEIADAGQNTVEQLRIYDFPAKLIRIIGRLRFRSSYGQNMLTHSIEMARLARLLATDFNAAFPHRKPIDVDICMKGALLHDIGKAVDEDTIPKGNHISKGEEICDTFGLDWRIKKCVSSHHNEEYVHPEHGLCLEAIIVDACDNISGARPGSRKEDVQAYYQRMEALEKIGEQTPGVDRCWIMKGSREMWIYFDTEKISSEMMHQTVAEITDKIEAEVVHPGEIKVIGIWEDKVVRYAH